MYVQTIPSAHALSCAVANSDSVSDTTGAGGGRLSIDDEIFIPTDGKSTGSEKKIRKH